MMPGILDSRLSFSGVHLNSLCFSCFRKLKKKNTSVAAIPPPPLSTPSVLFRDINTKGQHLQDPGRKRPLQQHSRSVVPQCLTQILSLLSYLVQTPRIQSVGCFRSLPTAQKYIIPTQTHHWTSKNLDLCNTKNWKKRSQKSFVVLPPSNVKEKMCLLMDGRR